MKEIAPRSAVFLMTFEENAEKKSALATTFPMFPLFYYEKTISCVAMAWSFRLVRCTDRPPLGPCMCPCKYQMKTTPTSRRILRFLKRTSKELRDTQGISMLTKKKKVQGTLPK